MKGIVMTDFDFDEWAKLFRDDPETFEARRLQCIENVIVSAPERMQEKLRKIQWRIDAERARCKTPYQAALRLNQMLMDSYLGEHGLAKLIFDLDAIFNDRRNDFVPIPAPKHDAAVLLLNADKTD
jgi:hypothetical protein